MVCCFFSPPVRRVILVLHFTHFLYFAVRVFSVCVLLRISCSLSRFSFTFVVAYVFFSATSSSFRKFYSLFLCLFFNVIEVKTVGEFSLICCTSMGHAGNTKIWAKITSTRAPNAATKPTTLEKSSYSPQSQKLTLREQLLETPVPCDMAKHAARENNLAAGTRV